MGRGGGRPAPEVDIAVGVGGEGRRGAAGAGLWRAGWGPSIVCWEVELSLRCKVWKLRES